MKVQIHLPRDMTASEVRDVVIAAMREAERQRVRERTEERQREAEREREYTP